MRVRALVAVLGVVALSAGCGGGGASEETAGETTASGKPIKTVTISETEYELEPDAITVAEPGTYAFKVVNEGSTTHALEIEGAGVEEETEEIEPGGSAMLTVEITKRGSYRLYCPVDDHEGKGMVGALTLSHADEGLPPGGSGGGTTTEPHVTTGGVETDEGGDEGESPPDDSGGYGGG